MKKSIYWILGVIFYLGLCGIVYAAALRGSGIGGMAEQATRSMGGLARVLSAGAYVGGIGFAIAGILKLKAHKESPTQIQISHGIVPLFVAAGLLFLPTSFQAVGGTMFGSSAGIAGPSGLRTIVGS